MNGVMFTEELYIFQTGSLDRLAIYESNPDIIIKKIGKMRNFN